MTPDIPKHQEMIFLNRQGRRAEIAYQRKSTKRGLNFTKPKKRK